LALAARPTEWTKPVTRVDRHFKGNQAVNRSLLYVGPHNSFRYAQFSHPIGSHRIWPATFDA
jgi:hypothetical protein